MTPARLAAIALVYCCSAVAWFVLGGTIVGRTGESDARLAREVAELWGGRHDQVAPAAHVERPRVVLEDVKDAKGLRVGEIRKTVVDLVPVAFDSSRIAASLALDHRRKGLLWYATYGVDFKATYRLRNPDHEERRVVVRFAFPSAHGLYDGFSFRVNGSSAGPVTDLEQGLSAGTLLAPRQEAIVEVAYRSRGLSDWAYSFVPSGVGQVSDFALTLDTDFEGYDFPAGAISPTRREQTAGGWRLGWHFESLATGQRIGIVAPNRLNPGPLASRITFFAPVGLLFFLTVMVILGVMGQRSLHPVNYFFLAVAFFAFHLLLAYLVDHLDVHAAFAIAAAVSVLLVVSYLRIVAGMRAALLQAGTAQLVFLVLFSYAFFFEGYTGLAVTVGAVITLFVLMQVTARLDWAELIARRERPAR